MPPLRKRSGNQYLHRATEEYRQQIRRKMAAYHRYVQLGCIAQGLLQYCPLPWPPVDSINKDTCRKLCHIRIIMKGLLHLGDTSLNPSSRISCLMSYLSLLILTAYSLSCVPKVPSMI